MYRPLSICGINLICVDVMVLRPVRVCSGKTQLSGAAMVVMRPEPVIKSIISVVIVR